MTFMNVSGRTVLLTGATGGIGHAIARRLHAAGAQLILTGRRTDVLEPLAAELGARSIAVDLSSPDEVERLVAEARAPDVVVANAAVPASGALLDFEIEQLDRALTVNLRAPMVMARLFGEEMVARGSGHLVFVSSLAGKAGTAGSSIYSATKFGLRGFAQGLRADLHTAGVGVSVVFPGFIRDAGMFAESDTELPRFVGTSTPEQVADGVLSAIENNRGEVDVAPAGMRLGAKLASVAPGFAAGLNRRMGADQISESLSAGQANKR
jgi:short-subunit dehydrogenase